MENDRQDSSSDATDEDISGKQRGTRRGCSKPKGHSNNNNNHNSVVTTSTMMMMEQEYSTNIAAACDAVNEESKRSRSPSEIHRMEKRRASNRVSARRCRRRRREEMNELTEELKRQSSIHEALKLEQVVLKEELDREIQGLQQGDPPTGTGLSAMTATTVSSAPGIATAAFLPAAKPPTPPPTTTLTTPSVPPSQLNPLQQQQQVLGGGSGGTSNQQDQAFQSLLGAFIENSRPTACAPPAAWDWNGIGLTAALLGNQVSATNAAAAASAAVTNAAPSPATQDALVAASAMLAAATAAAGVPSLSSSTTSATTTTTSSFPGMAGAVATGPAAAAAPTPSALYLSSLLQQPQPQPSHDHSGNDFATRLARLEAAIHPGLSTPALTTSITGSLDPRNDDALLSARLARLEAMMMNPLVQQQQLQQQQQQQQAISPDLWMMLLGGGSSNHQVGHNLPSFLGQNPKPF